MRGVRGITAVPMRYSAVLMQRYLSKSTLGQRDSSSLRRWQSRARCAEIREYVTNVAAGQFHGTRCMGRHRTKGVADTISCNLCNCDVGRRKGGHFVATIVVSDTAPQDIAPCMSASNEPLVALCGVRGICTKDINRLPNSSGIRP